MSERTIHGERANDADGDDSHAHDPHIKVVKGAPTAEELAAVVAVRGRRVGRASRAA